MLAERNDVERQLREARRKSDTEKKILREDLLEQMSINARLREELSWVQQQMSAAQRQGTGGPPQPATTGHATGACVPEHAK